MTERHAREESTYDETKSDELVFPTEVSIQIAGCGQRVTGILGYKYYGYKGSEHCAKGEENRESGDKVLFSAGHMF
jgi:hypothetical protein